MFGLTNNKYKAVRKKKCVLKNHIYSTNGVHHYFHFHTSSLARRQSI